MNPILRDLLDHQFWADEEHWNAIDANALAREDRAMLDRMHHIHQVQRFFIWAVGDRASQPALTRPDEYLSFDALLGYARESHEGIRAFLASVTDADLAKPVTMPWFRDPPLTISATEALTQLAMHSQHHRGQNLTRLRELGAAPPTLDLIIWYWKGRPPARSRA